VTRTRLWSEKPVCLQERRHSEKPLLLFFYELDFKMILLKKSGKTARVWTKLGLGIKDLNLVEIIEITA
jgi:hypothetical protein